MTAAQPAPQADPLQSLLQRLQQLEPTLRTHSRAAEQQKQLAAPVVQALREAGFYRLFRPRSLGGFGLDPVTEFQVAEKLAAIDAAAAWNVQVCNAGELYGGWFSEAAAAEVFGSADAIIAGSFYPRRRAEATREGYLISGTTPFNSNCHGADWLMGVAEVFEDNKAGMDAEGNPRVLLTLVPMRECRIQQNWNTMGMCGTGSHDVHIDRVFCPSSRAVPFTPGVAPPPAYDNPLTRMAIWATKGAHAAVALGVAQAAVDDLVELGGKVPAYTDASISSRPRVQFRLAQAEGKLASARTFFHHAYQQAWRTLQTRGVLSLQDKAQCQLACTTAVSNAAEAVDLVHTCVGTSGIRREHAFEKYFRDIHVITQHAFVNEARLEAVGQIMFGQQPDWPFFTF